MRLLLLLSLLASLSLAAPEPAKSQFYLRLNEPRDLLMEPYKLYEVRVPLKGLSANTSFWVRSYYNGGEANDAVMKRKGIVNKDAETLYKETDFFRRFQQTIQRGLKDHRYVMEFELTASKRYADDADQKRYLIAKEGDEEFLVFVFSIVKVAFAMDEAAFYKQIRANLELRENKLDSFSRL